VACHDATQAELAERLAQVRGRESPLHGFLSPPPDSPIHAVLRLADIQRYIGATRIQFQHWFPCLPRIVKRAPRAVVPKPHRMPEEKRQALAAFFSNWDRGLIVKARVGDEWTIVERYSHAAPLGSAPRPQAPPRAIKMTVDWDTLRFKR
jgi:hypothetical protein